MGHPAITLSTSDAAAVNMLRVFRESGFTDSGVPGVLRRGQIHLVVVEPPVVPTEEDNVPVGIDPYPADYDGIARSLGISYYVVASRHTARSGQPSLTLHATGNFSEPAYGGRARELQLVPPNPLRDVYMEVLKDPPQGFVVSLEATHHSPTQFRTPMFFAEVGNGPDQWGDLEACRHLSHAILRGIEARGKAPVALGFSGGHYCPKYSPLEREYAFGHIAAKYALPGIDDALIRQMVEKTAEPVEVAFIEDGAKGSDKRRIEAALKPLGVPLSVI